MPRLLVLIFFQHFFSIFALTSLVEKNGEHFCFSDALAAIAPVYNLDSLQPRRSFPNYNWTDDWELQGFRKSRGSFFWEFQSHWHDLPEIVTDGKEGYQTIFDNGDNGETDVQLLLSIMAQSASILLSSKNQWEGTSGYVIQLNKVNFASKEKELRILKCEILEVNCSPIYEADINLLNKGLFWSHLTVYVRKAQSGVTIEIEPFKNPKRYGITDETGFNSINFAAVNTGTTSGVFKIHTQQYLKASGQNSGTMIAKFKDYDNICIIIDFHIKLPTKLDYQLRNSSDIVVRNESFSSSFKFQTNLDVGKLEAGNYTLEISVETKGIIVNIRECKSSFVHVASAIKDQTLVGCQVVSRIDTFIPVLKAKKCDLIETSNVNRKEVLMCSILESWQELNCSKELKICTTAGCACSQTEENQIEASTAMPTSTTEQTCNCHKIDNLLMVFWILFSLAIALFVAYVILQCLWCKAPSVVEEDTMDEYATIDDTEIDS